jgi:4-diphosphocytidyl-2-C-methyl-D-erythritol kinase
MPLTPVLSDLHLSAPAKINLSLRVLRRREDGFHEIDSWMVRVPGLADQLVLKPTENQDVFSCSDPTVPGDDRNLVIKALNAYRQESGFTQPFEISLTKNVPHGAGLGGGSSDAASMLAGLDQFNPNPLGTKSLMEIAATIGSDIPFFLGFPACRVHGRGEFVEEAPLPPRLQMVLLKPSFGVPTPDAYKAWRDSVELPGINYSPQVFPWGELVNDLERPVFQKFMFLAEVKAWLQQRPETQAALMSGSGSTMIAVLKDGADAGALIAAAHAELDPTLWAWHGHIGD